MLWLSSANRWDEALAAAITNRCDPDAALLSQSGHSCYVDAALPPTDRPPPWDVFVSHRGPDTKMGFVDALQRHMRGRRVFVDRSGLRPGQHNWDTIRCSLQ